MMTSTRPAHAGCRGRRTTRQAVPERRHADRCRLGADEDDAPDGKVFWPTWAPSVARLGAGPLRGGVRRAAGQATDGAASRSRGSSAPLGPFVDRTTARSPAGVRTARSTRRSSATAAAVWMLYKVEGSPGPADGAPADRVGAPRSWPTAATTRCSRRGWPGRASLVENPAMIRFHERLYLFYSANDYRSARYATGYAICTDRHRAVHPHGPAALDRSLPRRPGRRDAVPRPGRPAAARLPRLARPDRSATRAPTAACETVGRLPAAADVRRDRSARASAAARRPPPLLRAGRARLALLGDLPDPVRRRRARTQRAQRAPGAARAGGAGRASRRPGCPTSGWR